MIEEISVCASIRSKKSDAERRLKNSKINLDKVTALIEEIEPHLRSLKRQTSRWERRGALEEELRSLENQFFGSQLHELRAKGEQVESRIAAHTNSMRFWRKKSARRKRARRRSKRASRRSASASRR